MVAMLLCTTTGKSHNKWLLRIGYSSHLSGTASRAKKSPTVTNRRGMGYATGEIGANANH